MRESNPRRRLELDFKRGQVHLLMQQYVRILDETMEKEKKKREKSGSSGSSGSSGGRRRTRKKRGGGHYYYCPTTEQSTWNDDGTIRCDVDLQKVDYKGQLEGELHGGRKKKTRKYKGNK